MRGEKNERKKRTRGEKNEQGKEWRKRKTFSLLVLNSFSPLALNIQALARKHVS